MTQIVALYIKTAAATLIDCWCVFFCVVFCQTVHAYGFDVCRQGLNKICIRLLYCIVAIKDNYAYCKWFFNYNYDYIDTGKKYTNPPSQTHCN